PNISYTTYCEFTPAGAYNTISGTVTFDVGNNGCTTGSIAAPTISIVRTAGSTSVGTTFTNSEGSYVTYPSLGGNNVTLAPQYENPYFTVSPTSFTSTFTGYGNSANADFCIIANGTHPDLEITL